MTNQFIDNHIQPLDLQQENANLRDLLNASMAENAAMLQQVTAMQEALNDAQASHHSAMFLLDEAQGDCNGWHDAYVALLWWSQDAYRKLAYHATLFPVPEIADMLDQESNADIVALLDGAPANVSAEVDPFSATVDENYSIYTDPLIVGAAEGLDCTIDELMEYATDSVGAPTDGRE